VARLLSLEILEIMILFFTLILVWLSLMLLTRGGGESYSIDKDSPFRGQTVPHREGIDGAGRDFTYNRLESTALDSTVRG